MHSSHLGICSWKIWPQISIPKPSFCIKRLNFSRINLTSSKSETKTKLHKDLLFIPSFWIFNDICDPWEIRAQIDNLLGYSTSGLAGRPSVFTIFRYFKVIDCECKNKHLFQAKLVNISLFNLNILKKHLTSLPRFWNPPWHILGEKTPLMLCVQKLVKPDLGRSTRESGKARLASWHVCPSQEWYFKTRPWKLFESS